MHQALGGEPCPQPISIGQAFAAGLAGGFVGAADPVAGFGSFYITMMKGIYAGILTAVISGTM
jgi:hypothetical protein